MDLQEFVKATLTQVVQGVKDANEAITELGGSVSPCGNVERQMIEFDVALTVETGKESIGKLRVAAWFIEAGTGGGSNAREQTVSRVQFKVPVLFPPGDTDEHFRAVRAETLRRNPRRQGPRLGGVYRAVRAAT